MVQVVPEELYFLGEVVIQTKPHVIILEGGGDVRLQGSTKACAGAVVMLRLLGDAIGIVVPSVSIQNGVLVIPIRVSVEGVRAGLADHVDLSARGASEARIVVGDADAELLDTIH